jgi:hypothetical protein
LLSQLTALLVDYPTLQKIVADETIGNTALQQPFIQNRFA